MANNRNLNMNDWIKTAAAQKKAMPVLSFPGIQLIDCTVRQLVDNGELQAKCMKAIADKYDTLAAVSLMDLSVEAEAFGSPVRFSDEEVPTVTTAIVMEQEDADNLKVPAVGDARTGEYVKCIQLACGLITDRPVFAGTIGPFSLAGRLMDMTEIMLKCFTDKEMVHTVLEKSTQFLIEYVKAMKEAGANGVVMAEPAAGLLSPKLIAEFSTPYVRRIIEAVEDETFLIVYHNCGRTIPLIKSILETGARAFHFGNAINMADMMPLVPEDRLVMGNVNPAEEFRNGTPKSVAEATYELLEACGGYANFIPSSGCDIPPVSPLANIGAFFETVAEFYNGALELDA